MLGIFFSIFILFIFESCGNNLFRKKVAAPTPLETVEDVDIEKYSEDPWYEIYRYPNWFEPKDCTDVSATYSIKKNGRIKVVNKCIKKNRKEKVAIGEAKLQNENVKGKLKVSFVKFFGKNIFYGDYWIIDLAEDYSWAIVSDEKRNYLWILSKDPNISNKLNETLIHRIKQLGFKKEKLIKTLHTKKVIV